MHVRILKTVSRNPIFTIEASVVFDAYQVPGVIVVVTDVSFIDPFKTNSIAHTIAKIFIRPDHLILATRIKLPSSRTIFLHIRCLLIVSNVFSVLLAQLLVLVLVLHYNFYYFKYPFSNLRITSVNL